MSEYSEGGFVWAGCVWRAPATHMVPFNPVSSQPRSTFIFPSERPGLVAFLALVYKPSGFDQAAINQSLCSISVYTLRSIFFKLTYFIHSDGLFLFEWKLCVFSPVTRIKRWHNLLIWILINNVQITCVWADVLTMRRRRRGDICLSPLQIVKSG